LFFVIELEHFWVLTLNLVNRFILNVPIIMKPKILLAGIAKDEAAYLPEWIFYHLNIGVHGVMIYVNNTNDNTVDILDKIKENHRVDYKIVDGIEKNQDEYFLKQISNNWLNYSPLQSKSYADIYRRTDSGDYDYVLFLDIDEFLCLGKNINDMDVKEDFVCDVTLFKWFSVTGDRKPFMNMFAEVKGEYDQFCKYMIKTGKNDVRFESVHKASIGMQKVEVYSGGLLVHRVLRSKVEYLALLARSNPTKKKLSNGFKLNRRGWTSKATASLPSQYAYIFDKYDDRFVEFCHSIDIDDELNSARQSVLCRAENVKKQIGLLLQQNSELGRVLDGTGLKHFSLFIWLKNELKNKFILRVFPSLRIKHVPFFTYIKYKLKIIKSDKYM
jgi:hypothetical protein